MPTRGYRKGISDSKVPSPAYVRSRLSTSDSNELIRQANDRSITVSALVRRVLAAHLRQQRAQLPHPAGPKQELLRQLVRIGNNLNQLTRALNAGVAPVSSVEVRACLTAINELARRL